MVMGDTGTGQARSVPELSGAPGAGISKYLHVFDLPQKSYQNPLATRAHPGQIEGTSSAARGTPAPAPAAHPPVSVSLFALS